MDSYPVTSRNRKVLIVAFIMIAAAVGTLLYINHRQNPLPVTSPISQVASSRAPDVPQRAVTQTSGNTPENAIIHPEGIAFGTAPSPKSEIEVLHRLFRAYREEYRSFPTGEDNAQFIRAMSGGNPRKIWYLPRPHQRIDPQGRLLDSWGTPYIFHAISRDYLEIRSAGPDKEIYNDDDLVHPPARPPQQ